MISSTYQVLYFEWKNRYLQLADLRYIPGFIFWIKKQVIATGQASTPHTDTCHISYYKYKISIYDLLSFEEIIQNINYINLEIKQKYCINQVINIINLYNLI